MDNKLNKTDNITHINFNIEVVYRLLKSRSINPSGYIDKQGRWYSHNNDLINVRTPYSQMNACRTRKYVKKVQEKFNCINVEELKNKV